MKKQVRRRRDPVTVSEISWHEKCSHRVLYPGENGKRRSKYFTNETDALEFAKGLKEELRLNGTSFGTVTSEEQAALDSWRVFKSQYEEAPDLQTVLSDYMRQWTASNASVTISEAMDNYIVEQEHEGCTAEHTNAIRNRVGRLAAEHGNCLVSDMTARRFTKWLNKQKGVRADKLGKKLSATTRNNLRSTNRSFFTYCIEQGWATSNPVPATKRKRTKQQRVAKHKQPEIMLPCDVERFLHKVEDVAEDILAFWLMKFFAGIRDAESARLDWSMVNMKAGKITLPAEITKTGDKRTVKMQKTLLHWIKPYAKKKGELAPGYSRRRYYYKKVLRHLAKEDKEADDGSKFTFPANAARHSFGTYHLYCFRDPGETAIQLGHKGNPQMLWEHYANTDAEEHAADFWEIKPGKSKVVSISKGRRSA